MQPIGIGKSSMGLSCCAQQAADSDFRSEVGKLELKHTEGGRATCQMLGKYHSPHGELVAGVGASGLPQIRPLLFKFESFGSFVIPLCWSCQRSWMVEACRTIQHFVAATPHPSRRPHSQNNAHIVTFRGELSMRLCPFTSVFGFLFSGLSS